MQNSTIHFHCFLFFPLTHNPMREEKEKKKEGKKAPLPLSKVTTALKHQPETTLPKS